MAESVDALVSNTSGATHPGSSPGLGTKKGEKFASLLFLCFNLLSFLLQCRRQEPKVSGAKRKANARGSYSLLC